MRFFIDLSYVRVNLFLSFCFFSSFVFADNSDSIIKDAGNKLLGDPYFYNQQCRSENKDSIFCLKDFFFEKSDWYPVGIISVGHKPEIVGKIVNGMENYDSVVLGTYEFNKLIDDKKATEIAILSSDKDEYGVFNISYLSSRVGMCKSLINLDDKNLFHYEDYSCDLSGSDYSFFGIVEKSHDSSDIKKSEIKKRDVNVKSGFYLLSNNGGKILGYKMPKGFSGSGRYYLMIK